MLKNTWNIWRFEGWNQSIPNFTKQSSEGHISVISEYFWTLPVPKPIYISWRSCLWALLPFCMPLDGSNQAEREASEKIWKFQNFSNFAPEMGKKVKLQQKKIVQIFSLQGVPKKMSFLRKIAITTLKLIQNAKVGSV